MIDLGADASMDCTGHGPPLLEALKRRNEDLVLSLLDAGADANYGRVQRRDWVWHKESSITLAVKWGNRSVIENLIFSGADVNLRTTHPNSEAPLTAAVKSGGPHMVHFLLALGADLNNPETQKYGGTALEAAVEKGDEVMTRFLLDLGADPKDSWALKKATMADVELLRILLDKWEATYKWKGDFGSRILAEAVLMGTEHVIRVMLEHGVSTNVMVFINGERATAFGHAIAKQQANFKGCLELFLASGCKGNDVVASRRHFYPDASERFNMQRDHGFVSHHNVTALLAAIDTQNASTVELLIDRGGHVNFPTRGLIIRTPLQRAAEIGSLEIVDLLLTHGANVNAPAAVRRGGTALQLAAIRGSIPIARKLLIHQANPNAPGSRVNGRTALEGAAEHNRLCMVMVLLDGGAGAGPGDVSQILRAIALAKAKGHFSIHKLLESRLFSVRRDSGMDLLTSEVANFGPPDADSFDPLEDVEY